eukprot:m.192295 g.192295  ORF g.192295 m.192295 type:complete len:74 (-) comp32458_c10_seq4:73-294(-)
MKYLSKLISINFDLKNKFGRDFIFKKNAIKSEHLRKTPPQLKFSIDLRIYTNTTQTNKHKTQNTKLSRSPQSF